MHNDYKVFHAEEAPFLAPCDWEVQSDRSITEQKSSNKLLKISVFNLWLTFLSSQPVMSFVKRKLLTLITAFSSAAPFEMC